MYIQGYPEYEHHRKTYGPQDKFGYPELFIVHKNPVSFRIFSKTDGYVFIFC